MDKIQRPSNCKIVTSLQHPYHIEKVIIPIISLTLFLISVELQVEQIQAEYKVLALQYHPDKNSGDKEAEAKFQQLKVKQFILIF